MFQRREERGAGRPGQPYSAIAVRTPLGLQLAVYCHESLHLIQSPSFQVSTNAGSFRSLVEMVHSGHYCIWYMVYGTLSGLRIYITTKPVRNLMATADDRHRYSEIDRDPQLIGASTPVVQPGCSSGPAARGSHGSWKDTIPCRTGVLRSCSRARRKSGEKKDALVAAWQLQV